MPEKTEWIRVSRTESCLVCDKPDYCTRSADGALAHCMRIESNKPASKGGWIHRLVDPLPQVVLPDKKPTPKIDAAAAARTMYRSSQASAKRAALANQLRVTVRSLELLGVGVGWDWNGREFGSFPSRDGIGKTVGITRRYDDGQKKTMRGTSNGGVFVAPKWWKEPGPVWLVEGASDTAALLSESLCVIGRPSNIAGILVIRKLIGRRARGRAVVVIGEHDEKLDRRGTVEQCKADCVGCAWCAPGLYGARETARQLRQFGAKWMMPPEGVKDVRAWRNASGAKFLGELIGRYVTMEGVDLIEQLKKIDRVSAEVSGLINSLEKTQADLVALRGTVDKLIARLKEKFEKQAEQPANGRQKGPQKPLKSCPVPGCKRQYRDDKIMCGFHWMPLPKEIKESVTAAKSDEERSAAVKRAISAASSSAG